MFNGYFVQAMNLEVRRSYKTLYYGWCYGSYKAQLVCADVCESYCMGGEL